MKWEHNSIIRDDLTSEGATTDGGTYRAIVHDGILPKGWKGKVEIWTINHGYYVAMIGDATSRTQAVQWCEKALVELQALVERLRHPAPERTPNA